MTDSIFRYTFHLNFKRILNPKLQNSVYPSFRMKRLTAQLQEQMAEGRKLDTTIMANPKELGYGN
ncbi:MAG: hypothetical protein NTW12_10560 [Deltaproteobacteria bacterium]|nr:hypothetical protein [Deltaproteobacteria bacterium]